MEHRTSIRTAGYAVGAGVLLVVLLLVAAITTGILPLRDSYAENPWPVRQEEVPGVITGEPPSDQANPPAIPTSTPEPTPTPDFEQMIPDFHPEEELPTYIVTVAFGKGGTAIPYGANTVVENGSITVVAVPDEGYVVEEMIVDGENLGAVDRYEIQSVNRNHSIYISFVRELFAPKPTPTAQPEDPAGTESVQDSGTLEETP